MSMLSAQIDELRAMAQLEKNLERPAIARILGDAADTIWELRDDLQRANAENAKLRERIDVAHMSRLLTENENESLRELCADMLHDAMENICSKAHWCDEKSWQTCNDEKCGNRLYVETARELGVEVG